MPGKPTIPRICLMCGADFLAHSPARYCSRSCWMTARHRRAVPPLLTDGAISLVPLMARGGVVRAWAIVDAADAVWVGLYRWHLNQKGYAVRTEWLDGRSTAVKLHRAVLGLIGHTGLEGDHLNRNRRDCRRSNLRAVPSAGRPNAQNRGANRGTSSPHRGVYRNTRERTWKAQIHINGKQIHLGTFHDESAAAEAARTARQRLMPWAVD